MQPKHQRILKGLLHPNQKISMFYALSQNYLHLLEEITYASYSNLSKELKNDIKILVGQAVLRLWIETVKMMIGSITQEPLRLPKF